MALSVATDKTFRKRVLERRNPVVVIVTARFCEASLELLPIVEKLEKSFAGRVDFVNFDLGDDEATARASKFVQRYKLSRLPVIAVLQNGIVKDVIGGIPTAENVRQMIDGQLRPVVDVGEHNFAREVLESRVPVLVHFHAASCAESKALVPVVEAAAAKLEGRSKVVRVDAEQFNMALCARYGINRFPVLAAFEAGEMRDCIMGPVTDKTMKRFQGADASAVDHVTSMIEQLV